jgi:hypothetical protein
MYKTLLKRCVVRRYMGQFVECTERCNNILLALYAWYKIEYKISRDSLMDSHMLVNSNWQTDPHFDDYQQTIL